MFAGRRLVLDDGGVARILYGPGNRNLQVLEKSGSVKIAVRGTELDISGSEEQVALHDKALASAMKSQFSPDQAIEGLTNLATAGLNDLMDLCR